MFLTFGVQVLLCGNLGLLMDWLGSLHIKSSIAVLRGLLSRHNVDP